jgi:hypothetical protein
MKSALEFLPFSTNPPGGSLRGAAAMAGIIGLCLLYAVLATGQLMSGRLDNYQTHGIHPARTTMLPGGPLHVEYSLPSRIDNIDDVAIFITENSRLGNRGQRMNLEVHGENSSTRSIILGEANQNYREYGGNSGNPAALVFYHLDIARSEDDSSQILLKFSMPDARGGELELIAQPRQPDGRDSSLFIGGQELTDMDIGIQVREVNARRLWRLFLIGCILVVLSLAAMWNRRFLPLPVLLVGFPMALILAEICWQQRLDLYWNYFWPDGYVELAHQVRLWLNGDSAWNQLSGYLSSYRNGQSWLIPLCIALLSATGISYLLAFTLVNYLAYLVMALAWLGLFRRAFPWASPARLSLFLLVILFHYLHLLSGGTPMTDIGAAAFVALFFYSFYSLLSRSKQTAGSVVIPAIVIALACQTRIALLPLVLTPLGVAIAIALTDKYLLPPDKGLSSSSRRYMLIAAPTFISAAILLIFYTLLNLFGTFQLARLVATSEVFQSGFSMNDFLGFTLNVCLAGLVVTAIYWRKVIGNPLLLALWIFTFGYLVMLYLGQIITWERYWIPVAGAATFCALGTLNLGRYERVYLCCAVILLGAQFYFLFHNNLDYI